MATAKFAFCFPSGDGKMICQHWNGNWIVFPMRGDFRFKKNEKSSKKEDDSED